MSNSLWPHGLQHARLPCPSVSPGVCSNSCPLSQFSSVQLSCSVMSDSLQPHEPQHARLPCPLPTPEVHPNPCQSSRWCHPTISSCHPLLLPPSIFPSIRVFSNESAILIRWPKYWSFSFSTSASNEYSGFISFKINWFVILAVQGTLKSLPTPPFKGIQLFSLLYGLTLTSTHDYFD